jgi:hypothetical protein
MLSVTGGGRYNQKPINIHRVWQTWISYWANDARRIRAPDVLHSKPNPKKIPRSSTATWPSINLKTKGTQCFLWEYQSGTEPSGTIITIHCHLKTNYAPDPCGKKTPHSKQYHHSKTYLKSAGVAKSTFHFLPSTNMPSAYTSTIF